MPFVEFAGSRIHYEVSGPERAPVLVLSNSLGTTLSMWDPQMPALLQRFRVVRYDKRGHGLSSLTPGPYSFDLLGHDVVRLLDALSLDRVYYCGLSMGGMTGMWLGAHAPERLHKMALCNTSPYMPPTELWNQRIDAVRKGGMPALIPGILDRWYTPAFRARSPEAIQFTERMLLDTPAEAYASCCAAIRDMDLRESITGIRVPTMVIAGTYDPGTTPAYGRLIADSIPGAEYVELPAAHMSNIECAERFTSEVLRFLTA